MVNHLPKAKPLKKRMVRFICLMSIGMALLSFIGCQQSSDESTVSSNTDRTAPTTTITVSAFCTLTGLTVNACTASPITVTFTADETATVYYAQGASSGVSVSTSSSSVDSGSSIDVTGNEGDIVYVAFFAQDSAGNSESTRELTIAIPDLTDPVTSISFVVTADSSNCTEIIANSDYLCTGPITVTMTVADNTATTLYYDATTDTPSIPTTASTQYTAPISIDVNDTYLSFFAQDSANNQENVRTYYFEIDGISTTINGGYYNTNPTFKFALSSNRPVPNGYYQLYYLARTGTDVSADSTSDADSVFSSGASPSANASAVRYLNTYLSAQDLVDEDVATILPTDDTLIYQYKYNIIFDGTQDASDDVANGTIDKENALVLYIDTDAPKAIALPPSSGSLDSTIQVTTYIQDNGHDKVEQYASTNTNLATATPLQSPTATYCKSTSILAEGATFWSYCEDPTNQLGLTSGSPVTITQDTLMGLKVQDAASNKISCDSATYKQYSCYPANVPPTDPHFAELYTPGQQRSSYYHENENDLNAKTNFGHAIAIGDLDNDGSSDIAIGAPAYSYTLGLSQNIRKGAVYVWYNGFRERALLSLIDNSTTANVTSRYMEFATDGLNSFRIYLDPSTDTSGYASDKFQADAGDYTDRTQATAGEIAAVLNEAFLSSFGRTYQNYLYADPSTDSKLSIGHINQTLQGYFTYTSNFDTTSDMYYAGSSVRTYDYVIYGENDDDEFGYAVAMGQVDTSVDTATYSSQQLIVGAPGYNSDNGALYVVRMPASDASADYGTVTLVDSTTDAYIIHATSGTGRLGHAITLYDNTSDGYNDIYTSAPYYDSAPYSNNGAVYKIDQQDFTYSDSTNDIATAAASSYEWLGTDGAGADATDALFGFSLTAGHILADPYNPNSQYLFIGVPGLEGSGNTMIGRVAYLDIRSGAASFNFQLANYYEDYDAIVQTYFGYSLQIVNSEFDTTGTSKCPCLAIGAPGASGSQGKVWLMGKSGFAESLTGTNSTDMIGISLLAGKIGSSDTFDTLFITARSANNKGHLVIARKQLLTDNTDITAEALNSDLEGSENGDHLGQGLAIITINGVKALATGLPGELTLDRTGSVRIYSGTRLGY